MQDFRSAVFALLTERFWPIAPERIVRPCQTSCKRRGDGRAAAPVPDVSLKLRDNDVFYRDFATRELLLLYRECVLGNFRYLASEPVTNVISGISETRSLAFRRMS